MYTVTLNPADKSANITLSGSNMIATAAAGPAGIGVRGTLGRYVISPVTIFGTFYYEVTLNVVSNYTLGFGTLAATLTTAVGFQTLTVGYHTGTNLIGRENAETVAASWAIPVNGDVMGVELNNITGFFKIYKNGVESTTTHATAITVGTYYPMIGLYNVNDQVTVNFGATPFTFPPPGGHIPWAADERPNHPPPRSSIARQYPVQHIRL